MTAEQILSVSFRLPESEGLVLLRLDGDRNSGQTSFAFNSKAYFQVLTLPPDLSVEVATSDGQVAGEGSGTMTITEHIAFDRDNLASTGLPINRIVNLLWLGEDLGGVTVQGMNIRSAKTGVGILRITYLADFRRYSVFLPTRPTAAGPDGENEYPVLVSVQGKATGDDRNDRPAATLQITFKPLAAAGLVEVYARLSDWCSGDPIAGAAAAINGSTVAGQTDDEGLIYLGALRSGSSHTLTGSASGYRTREKTFTVPQAGE